MVNIKKWEEEEHWVEIDLDLCVGAAECVEVFPVEVYDIENGKVIAENIAECIDCMACQDVCPTNAILNHSAW
ncbi:MAG: ferredoxin family protein [Promethearchaeota archaeon]|nr:MAG: ferredoxin family protein [Candidatus Lokiarchaeota archaeon]